MIGVALVVGGLLLAAVKGQGAPRASTPLLSVSRTPEAFVAAMWNASLEDFEDLGEEGRVLLIAHAAKESGWGSLGQQRGVTNNVFNLTAGTSWGGMTVKGNDVDKNGKPIPQLWRVYPDLQWAVYDYRAFLTSLYPAAYRELLGAARPAQFAYALVARLKYYAEDPAVYASALEAFVAQVRVRIAHVA